MRHEHEHESCCCCCHESCVTVTTVRTLTREARVSTTSRLRHWLGARVRWEPRLVGPRAAEVLWNLLGVNVLLQCRERRRRAHDGDLLASLGGDQRLCARRDDVEAWRPQQGCAAAAVAQQRCSCCHYCGKAAQGAGAVRPCRRLRAGSNPAARTEERPSASDPSRGVDDEDGRVQLRIVLHGNLRVALQQRDVPQH